MLFLASVVLFISCRSSEPIPKTAEEIAFARLAVLEMMELTVAASSDDFLRESGWEGTVADLVPPEAATVVRDIDKVPGLRRLMDRYIKAMNETVAAIAPDLSSHVRSELLPSLEIPDPFALIETDRDAVTRHFASRTTDAIEAWLEKQLRGPKAQSALDAWQRVLRTHETYTRSKQLLGSTDSISDPQEPKADPVRTVVVTIIRQLLSTMRDQELLIRAMAPAYDNPLITPFARQ